MKTWRMISIGGMGFLGIFGGYMMYSLSGHHSHFDPEKNAFAYMKTRTKAYPWECSNCNLFDSKW